jgi:serine protease Do
LVPDSKKRSSVDSDMSLEDFFGNSDQAVQTRITLAELAPVFDIMAASMRQQMQENRSIIDAGRMMAILHFWSPGHDTRREIETAQQQLHAAALAARSTLSPVDLREDVVATRSNLD